jgi:hypothetical protein
VNEKTPHRSPPLTLLIVLSASLLLALGVLTLLGSLGFAGVIMLAAVLIAYLIFPAVQLLKRFIPAIVAIDRDDLVDLRRACRGRDLHRRSALDRSGARLDRLAPRARAEADGRDRQSGQSPLLEIAQRRPQLYRGVLRIRPSSFFQPTESSSCKGRL